jgi:DNA primase
VKNVLNKIKEQLIESPEKLVELLEHFSFEHINHRNTEIRFARSDVGGANISIRLKNNPYCCVSDWSRGVNTDIISYIIQEKSVEFREVLQAAKKILNLSDDWRPQQRRELFGGIYSNLACQNREIKLKTYDESILDKYEQIGNLRFLRDGISLDAQKFFNIRFSAEDNAIILPLHNEFGDLVGVKARINDIPQEGESKYYYPVPTQVSKILYGYDANYQHLYGNDIVVVESEKAVAQAYTFGVRNIVGLGSSAVSEKQSTLLLQLQPKRIILAFDEGLAFEQIQRNADMIKSRCSMFETEIWYWDADQDLDIGAKCSPTDMGKEKFEEIMREQLIRIY